ncbi:MAG: accessory factor associated with RNA polymerase II [Thelocarpon impressellum]|nr:MAG: accessory factor associated with RNA polymerase II [Thelocarpon impressellum]
MASADALENDPLLRLRHAQKTQGAVIPTTSAEDPGAGDVESNLAAATHLFFSEPTRRSFPLDTPTRFTSADKPVNLRSIWFAWQRKDDPIPAYVAEAERLNEQLRGRGQDGELQNLVFVERLDLITWLEGASEESEYIKPLASEGAAAAASGSAQVASGAAGGIATVPSGDASRPGRRLDPRLAEIYNGERRMGDRNTVLRGIKPTDFSHVRKSAETFLGKGRGRPSGTGAHAANAALVSLPKKPSSGGRRPDPIILLSPSASSLLRMSNIKAFLEGGTYIPPDSALAGSSNSANILHISRLLPTVDATRPLRFILVDTPEQFKPDYWNRVVAVFTTGQTWQFKSYKWQQPQDLFRNVLGVYVGWRGEAPPATVKGWGRGVSSAAVDKWSANAGAQTRWRDREVVEGIWGAIEQAMRGRGWGRER